MEYKKKSPGGFKLPGLFALSLDGNNIIGGKDNHFPGLFVYSIERSTIN